MVFFDKINDILIVGFARSGDFDLLAHIGMAS